MQIAIISDTHDNFATTEKALLWIKRHSIRTLIHCGDLCAPTFLTQFLAKKFPGAIHLVYGNVGDRKALEERVGSFPNVEYHRDVGKIKIGSKKIAFTHLPAKAKELAQTGKYDIVFYGHTHRPWEDRIKIKDSSLGLKILKNRQPAAKSVRLVNPGTLAGMFYKATFAVYDPTTDKLELKILERL
ncbi:MAG: metallophosphoesterase family protein [Candidatus Parcubacteria bacterium]|nr:metallophosphoesterase family protein [Candidatus Parcubacteria bacterium]